MNNILTQLRSYFEDFDEKLPPVDVERAVGDDAIRETPRNVRKPTEHIRQGVGRRRVLAGALTAAGAAAAVGAVFGVLLVLDPFGGGSSPGATPADMATDEATTAATVPTSAPPTVTTQELPATTVAPAVDAPDMDWRLYASEALSDAFVIHGSVAAVVAGRSGLVAVGWASDGYCSDAAVWASPDGITWSRVADDGALSGPGDGLADDCQAMNDVAPWGDGFVAVGTVDLGGAESEDSGSSGAAVWTSADGSMWARVPHQAAFESPAGSLQMTGIASAGSTLVAVGHEFTPEPWEHTAAIWVSADGVSWERVPNPEDEQMWLRDVVAVGERLFAVGTYEGGAPLVWESADGAVWRVLSIPCPACDEGGWSPAHFGLGSEFFAGAFAVAAGEPGIAVVGVIDPEGERPVAGVWLSADGTDWELAAMFDSTDRKYNVRATAVAWDGDRLIVAGHEESDTNRLTEVVWVSPDAGSTWFEVARGPMVEMPQENRASMPTGAVGDVVSYGPGVVVVSGAGYSWVGTWVED